MNAVIYYGAPARPGQHVSEEVKAKGISLLRSTPTEAYPLVIRTVNTPQYALYVANFGAAAEAAEKDMYVNYGSTTRYYTPTKLFTPVYQRVPSVIWSYERTMTNETLNGIRDRFSAAETVSNKKPAFVAKLSPSQVAGLKGDTNPSEITPCSTTTLNIRAYRAFLRLHKIADFFFRIHQYPLAPEGTTMSKYFADAMQIPQKIVEGGMVTVGIYLDKGQVLMGRAVQLRKG